MPRSKKSGRAAKAARFRAATATAAKPRNETFVAAALNKIVGAHGFSMKDEARNTAHNHGTWGQDPRLRARPVIFVSAGLIEPLKNLSLDGSDREQDPAQSGEQLRPSSDVEAQGPAICHNLRPQEAGEVAGDNTPNSALVDERPHDPFFVDTTGDKSLSAVNASKSIAPKPAAPFTPQPAPSGDDSDSSEEVILFKGRNPPPRGTDHADVARDEIHIQIQAVTQRIEDTSLSSTKLETHRTARLGTPQSDTQAEQDDEDAIIADYIANIANDDDLDEDISLEPYFNPKGLGASDDEVAFDGSHDEAENADMLNQDDNLDSLSSSEGDAGDEEDDDGEEEDVLDNQVDDEELARIIAKQEELGLGGDDILLFSADYTAGSKFSQGLARRKKGSSLAQIAQSKKTNRSMPSASALADAFDDFDLMDWGRSNPQLKTKGKRAEVTFDVSDSELDAVLQEAWQKDRATKKEKKRAREELRAQGLLGSKANPDDPRVKYQGGMSLEDIKSELKVFLLSSDTTMALPPMDAPARKMIHEIANKFKIKSKSAGSGDQRRPALYRTKNTVKYTEFHFEQAFARLGRRYFPRLDSGGKAPRRTGGSGRVNHAAVTYRDGEVVGASAPELGESNKGRTMLEKMGWSSGMALGALDNKGILQPVAHVVKRSKAGLG